MLFIWYPKCSTCQKAKKFLLDHHVSFSQRHIVEEALSKEELLHLYQKSGLPLKKFFNTSGKLYKENKDSYALLNVYENSYGVCGTGRTEDAFTLNNNQEAIIGYYNNNSIWSDISFKDYAPRVAIINYSLKENDAKEILEFIKTLEITEN